MIHGKASTAAPRLHLSMCFTPPPHDTFQPVNPRLRGLIFDSVATDIRALMSRPTKGTDSHTGTGANISDYSEAGAEVQPAAPGSNHPRDKCTQFVFDRQIPSAANERVCDQCYCKYALSVLRCYCLVLNRFIST